MTDGLAFIANVTLERLFLSTKGRINVLLLLAESDLENETTINFYKFEANKVAHENESFVLS